MNLLLKLVALGIACMPAVAAETRSSTPGAPPVAAKLADLTWLVGEWRGPGIDQAEATELWAAPRDGQMVGVFRQLDASGKISFYELMTLVQIGATIELRIKHFDARLHGWEKVEEVTTFPLVAKERGIWYFDGLTLQRLARNRAKITVRIQEAATKPPVEIQFHYTRQR
jgi:Domain of unknown function (DUF6265)